MDTNTTIKIEEKYTTDASPSWNGYNHQGKVGIFVVLKMINELKLNFDSCIEYDLELEWLEDFSIKKKNKYISIHQVKTYNKTAPSEYKDAIWLLLAKLLDFPGIQQAYLHSTSKINKLNNLKTNLFKYEPPKEKDTTTEAKTDDNSKKQQKKYWTPKQCHDYVKNNNRYNEAFEKFAVYSYDEDCNHCSMNEIENKIKDQLAIFYNDKKTTEQLDRTYLHLLGLVDQNIRDRHMEIQVKKTELKATISFQNVYKLIMVNYEIPSKEFVIYKLRDRFSKLTTEYLEDLYMEDDDDSIDIVDKRNLHLLINSVLELSDDDFLKFCMKITPHHEISEDDPSSILDALSSFISETHMTEGFLEILKQIKKEIDTQRHTFFKMGTEKKNISYLPTTIIDSYHKQRIGRMVEKILKNDESLNEVDVMITKQLNLERLKSEKISEDIPEIDDTMETIPMNKGRFYPREEHDRISKIKRIRVVDIFTAKGELDQ